jgi:hypothetical protein
MESSPGDAFEIEHGPDTLDIDTHGLVFGYSECGHCARMRKIELDCGAVDIRLAAFTHREFHTVGVCLQVMAQQQTQPAVTGDEGVAVSLEMEPGRAPALAGVQEREEGRTLSGANEKRAIPNVNLSSRRE